MPPETYETPEAVLTISSFGRARDRDVECRAHQCGAGPVALRSSARTRKFFVIAFRPDIHCFKCKPGWQRANRAGTRTLVTDLAVRSEASANSSMHRHRGLFRALAHRKSAMAAHAAERSHAHTAAMSPLRPRYCRGTRSTPGLRRPCIGGANPNRRLRESAARDRQTSCAAARTATSPHSSVRSRVVVGGNWTGRAAMRHCRRNSTASPSECRVDLDIQGTGGEVGRCQQRRNHELARRGSRHSGLRGRVRDSDGRLDPAHPPIVACQFHALTDDFGERPARAVVGPQPFDHRMARCDCLAGGRRYSADAVAHPRIVGAGPQQARPELRKKLNALQVAHQTVTQAGRELAQNHVPDGIRVPVAGGVHRVSAVTLSAVRFPRETARVPQARRASPSDDRSRRRASGACRRAVPSP